METSCQATKGVTDKWLKDDSGKARKSKAIVIPFDLHTLQVFDIHFVAVCRCAPSLAGQICVQDENTDLYKIVLLKLYLIVQLDL